MMKMTIVIMMIILNETPMITVKMILLIDNDKHEKHKRQNVEHIG